MSVCRTRTIFYYLLAAGAAACCMYLFLSVGPTVCQQQQHQPRRLLVGQLGDAGRLGPEEASICWSIACLLPSTQDLQPGTNEALLQLCNVQLLQAELQAPPALPLPLTFGGVQHFAIPGALNATPPTVGNGTVAGVLHLFLKALWCADGHLRLRGFAFLEPAIEPEHFRSQPILRQVPIRNIPEAKHLRLGVRSASGKWEAPAPLRTAACIHIPAQRTQDYQRCVEEQERKPPALSYYDFPHLFLDFGPDTPPPDVELFVDGWPRYISLAPLLAAAGRETQPAAAASRGLGHAIRHLLTYPFGLQASLVGRLLAWRAQYYKSIGIASTVLYLQPADLLAYTAEPFLRDLVGQGLLALVDWSALPYFAGWPYYSQQIALEHGVLSHWGSGYWLWVSDLDEFPAIPNGSSLPALLAPGGCLSAFSDCMTLRGFDVYPAPPAQQDSASNSSTETSASRGAEARGAALDEAAVWRSSTSDPLERYRRRSQTSKLTKMLLDPSRVFGVTPHFAAVCLGSSGEEGSSGVVAAGCNQTRSCFAVDSSCAWVAHALNMFRRRAEVAKDVVNDTAWLWMY